MNVLDLTPEFDSERVLNQFAKQFDQKILIDTMSLHECKTFLNRISTYINKYKEINGIFESEKNSNYIKSLMLYEAIIKRISKLTESQESNMKQSYLKALKHVAKGGKLSESEVTNLNVSKKLQNVLESREKSIKFIEYIVRHKQAINEDLDKIDTAQIILAAQDIVDQVQNMIEKFADIQYKELPALNVGIRKEISVETAESFNQQVLGSIQSLTQSLENTRSKLNNAVGLLTGEQMGDLDMGDLEDEDNLDMNLDLGSEEGEEGEEELEEPEEELEEPEEEPEEEEELRNLGREKR